MARVVLLNSTMRPRSSVPEVDWVTPFEEDTGCQVTSKGYGTSDEALNLAKADLNAVIESSGGVCSLCGGALNLDSLVHAHGEA